MGDHRRVEKSIAAGMQSMQLAWTLATACGLGILLTLAPSPARAIDCQKAATIVERAICRDPEVKALDSRLTEALQKMVDAHPNQQDEIWFDERHWFDERDARCEPYANAAPKMHRCLEEVYSTRLSEIRHAESPVVAAPATGSNVAVCNTLLDRYRSLASAHPGESPVRVLAGSGTVGFKLEDRGHVVNSAADLQSWAKRQQPPISISHQVSAAFDENPDSGMLQKAPGLSFFMLSLSSYRSCDSFVYFSVRDGVAVLSQKPLGDSASDEGCQGHDFASLDSVPLFVRETETPGMRTTLEVATWRSDHFKAACTVSLSYLPRVIPNALSQSADTCNGPGCDAMRKAAVQFVEERVTAGLSAESLLQRLTDKQREVYQAEETVAEDTSEADEPEDVDLVPYVRLGEVYVARVGDRAEGGRYPDQQRVKFEQLEEGMLVEKAAFTVDVLKGEIETATVQPAP
jgi:uncharacterized protein